MGKSSQHTCLLIIAQTTHTSLYSRYLADHVGVRAGVMARGGLPARLSAQLSGLFPERAPPSPWVSASAKALQWLFVENVPECSHLGQLEPPWGFPWAPTPRSGVLTLLNVPLEILLKQSVSKGSHCVNPSMVVRRVLCGLILVLAKS